MPENNEEIKVTTLPLLAPSASLDTERPRIIQERDMGDIQYQSLSAVIVPEGLSEGKQKEVMIFEALKRPTLEWWERCILEKQFHDMRQAQLGLPSAGRGRVKTGWSLRDTAEEMGIGFGNLSEDLRLAEAVMANPNLRKIEDKATARRLIFNMAKRMEAEEEAGVPVLCNFNIALHGDSAQILAEYPEKVFDVCITDPPWLEYKDQSLIKDDRTVPVFDAVYRVMKQDSFLYAFVSTDDWIFYRNYLEKIGFRVQKFPLIWVKTNHLSHGVRSWEYMRDFEPILLAVKGAPHVTSACPPSAIYTYPIVHQTKSIHPNEKPIELIKHILAQCSYEGSLVLDPFGGSGVTAEACKVENRRYVTIERNREFFKNIEKRLEEK